MTPTTLAPGDIRTRPLSSGAVPDGTESHASAVSWGAVFAGAAGAAALSLILLILGAGLGMSTVSPWANQGASATTLGASTIIWITLTQLLAAGLGGYLAGRLRTKWSAVHADEVYFRDTAHGFLTWSVATLLTAAALGSAIGSIVGSTLQAGGAVISGAGTAATTVAGASAAKPGTGDMGAGYFMDSLFRRAPDATAAQSADATAAAVTSGVSPSSNASPTPPTPPTAPTAGPAEIGRIFLNSISTGALPADDARYAGQLVAQATGLPQQQAEKRVADTYARMQTKLRDAETAAREAADKARKASAYTALWLFISLLIGAFTASLAATYGGRRRDL